MDWGTEANAFLAWFAERAAGPLLAGAAIAWVGSYFLTRHNERFKSRREQLSKAADTLCDQIDALIEISGAYWCPAADKVNKDAALEARIQFILDDIATLANACLEPLWTDLDDAAPKAVADLLTAAAPADFGAIGRAADPNRVRAIGRAGARLSSLVREARSTYFEGRSRRRLDPYADVRFVEQFVTLIALVPAAMLLASWASRAADGLPLSGALGVGAFAGLVFRIAANRALGLRAAVEIAFVVQLGWLATSSTLSGTALLGASLIAYRCVDLMLRPPDAHGTTSR